MLEININFRLNSTAVTSLGQKVNKIHAIWHTVLRIFLPMALEKPTRGKPVRERESFFIMLLGKNQTFIYSQNPTYLNPTGCLVFCANAATISLQYFSRKQCRNSSNLQPRFLCRKRKFMPSICVHTLQENHTVRTTLNAVVQSSKTVPRKCCQQPRKMCLFFPSIFVPKMCLGNCAKNYIVQILYLLEILAYTKCSCTLLGFCAK